MINTSKMEESLTKNEALYFISNVLCINNIEEELALNRLKTLDHLVRGFHETIPFQNIYLMSLEPYERHLPTWAEIKETMMLKQGGLCYVLNVFMKKLLEALQFDAYHIMCSTAGYTNNHIATIVQNATSGGSKHLVDLMGYPIFKAIPLDFEDESPVYCMSFLTFKYIREKQSIVWVHQNRDDLEMIDISNNDKRLHNSRIWRRFSIIDLEPRELTFFENYVIESYTVPDVKSPLLSSLRIVVFPGLQLCGVKDGVELLEKDNHEIQCKKLASKEELILSIRKNFPQFPDAMIIAAVERFLIVYKKKNLVSPYNDLSKL